MTVSSVPWPLTSSSTTTLIITSPFGVRPSSLRYWTAMIWLATPLFMSQEPRP